MAASLKAHLKKNATVSEIKIEDESVTNVQYVEKMDQESAATTLAAAIPRVAARPAPERCTIVPGMSCFLYVPAQTPRGLVVLAPGSWGGMGPGQTSAEGAKGIFSLKIRTIYTELAEHLANDEGLAVCHFTWRKPPSRVGMKKGTLRSPKTLLDGAADVTLAASFLRQRCDCKTRLPMVLVGFSYGGPSIMAASKHSFDLESAGNRHHENSLMPLAGVVTIGSGMREDHGAVQFHGLDSASCSKALAAHHVPLCVMCGLADKTVDPQCSKEIFASCDGPKAAVWLEGTAHHMLSRVTDATTVLAQWVPQLFDPYEKTPAWLCSKEATIM